MSDFLGTGWSFPPQFEKDAGVTMVSGEEDIAQSLRILFGTQRGERPFQSEYGLDMQTLQFESMSTTMVTLLEDRIKISVLLYEPRIEPIAVRVTTPDAYSGQLQVELEYRVRATNSRYNLVFPFYRSDSNELVQSAARALTWTSSST
ncbi:MAG TPA: GPW/gp25 family protein [Burkholderiales bacterium]|nr:GPW/gp25 family protein [Burkholderiales bacterium]